MPTPLYQVDAFTETPFKGNPAGVCLLEQPQKASWMQDVARENNLSETAFVWSGSGDLWIRWFTPEVEVDLCGHATLASAHVLFEGSFLKSDQAVRFHSHSGLLTARRLKGFIEMDFPAKPQHSVNAPPRLAEALGIEPIYAGSDGSDYLALLEREEDVRELKPRMDLLKTLEARGICVTARAGASGVDFVSRFFAPNVGIPEDPVTGSAHCCLGPFWMGRLGKSELVAHQVSARGGVVHVRVAGDRVFLGGQAVTVFKGEILV
jgi:PhzF family phenazine biosynthesis protein